MDHFIHIFDLIRAFGDDAIKIQTQWNGAYQADLLTFQTLIHRLPPHLGKALTGLCPRRQVLDTLSFEHRVRVSVTEEITTQVRLKPLNLAYDTLFGRTAEKESRIKITLEQVGIDGVRYTAHKTRGG